MIDEPMDAAPKLKHVGPNSGRGVIDFVEDDRGAYGRKVTKSVSDARAAVDGTAEFMQGEDAPCARKTDECLRVDVRMRGVFER